MSNAGRVARYVLLDEQGRERKAWETALGKRQSVQGHLWWAKFGRDIHLTVKVRAVHHAAVPTMPFFLVVGSCEGMGLALVFAHQ